MTPFEKAFAAARKAGKKEFTFKGKSYHTKLKEEVEGATTRPKRNPNRPPSVQSEAPKMGAAPAKAKPVTISDKKPAAKAKPTQGPKLPKDMSRNERKKAGLPTSPLGRLLFGGSGATRGNPRPKKK